MKLLIVIVNYRVADLTIDCLHSLSGEMKKLSDARVAVVENGTGDDSANKIQGAIDKNGWASWCDLTAIPIISDLPEATTSFSGQRWSRQILRNISCCSMRIQSYGRTPLTGCLSLWIATRRLGLPAAAWSSQTVSRKDRHFAFSRRLASSKPISGLDLSRASSTDGWWRRRCVTRPSRPTGFRVHA